MIVYNTVSWILKWGGKTRSGTEKIYLHPNTFAHLRSKIHHTIVSENEIFFPLPSNCVMRGRVGSYSTLIYYLCTQLFPRYTFSLHPSSVPTTTVWIAWSCFFGYHVRLLEAFCLFGRLCIFHHLMMLILQNLSFGLFSF